MRTIAKTHVPLSSNLLWWSLGPMLELLGLAGVVWLFFRRDPRAVVVAAFAVIYYAVAGHTVAPMIRYTLPLAPALAVAAGVLGADWLQRSRNRVLPRIVRHYSPMTFTTAPQVGRSRCTYR